MLIFPLHSTLSRSYFVLRTKIYALFKSDKLCIELLQILLLVSRDQSRPPVKQDSCMVQRPVIRHGFATFIFNFSLSNKRAILSSKTYRPPDRGDTNTVSSA